MKIHRSLTLVLPYYMNPGMLREQQRAWALYPEALRARLHVIVVDDGSPSAPARDAFAPVAGLASQRLYRLTDDVRWNWLACRNLGVKHRSTEWVLLTDIDHVLPADTLATVLGRKLHDTQVYRLSRVDAPHPLPYQLHECQVRMKNDRVHIHPNTWLMTGEMFDRIGGYDERLSGCYGTDGEFRARVHGYAASVVLLDVPLVRYSREIIADASTTCFTRKGDPENDAELTKRREARAKLGQWVPLRGSFAYVQECAYAVSQAVSA